MICIISPIKFYAKMCGYFAREKSRFYEWVIRNLEFVKKRIEVKYLKNLGMALIQK